MSLLYPRSHRLRTAQQFKDIFRNSKRFVRGSLILYCGKNTLEHPRLGVCVPKKYIKKAVQRNQIKRLVRESFRAHQNQLPALDLVVLVVKGCDVYTNKQLREQLDQLWIKFIAQQRK